MAVDMAVQSAAGEFRTCGACKHAWSTWDSFVLDPAVRLLGLQVQIYNPDFNALIFEHRCGSSISVLTPRLRYLLPEPKLAEPPALLMSTEQCRGHCRSLEDLEACDAPCSNARDRTLILLIQLLKKEANMAANPGRTG